MGYLMRWPLRAGILVAAALSVTVALAVAAPGRAQAYSNAFYCYNWPQTYCWDPTPESQGGAWHNWEQGEIQNLSYTSGYQCMAVSDSHTWSTRNCATYTVYEGGTFYWDWGDLFDSHWPIAGAGEQVMLTSFSTFWNWFSG
ncbi:MAG: hypothetical protein JOZ07_05950 [Solirubrobacterales bacterium]|nr:hypothetical protein [Solirubrobacterales bacterium]